MTSTDIRVIPIDSSFAQVLSDLGKKLYSATFSPSNEPADVQAYLDEAYTFDIQLKELNDPTVWSFMAFDSNGTPVGFTQLRQNKQVYDFVGDIGAIELQRIYVDKSVAGKGIGKLLIDTCLSKAKELNKQTVWLGVWEHNPTAIKFYRRQGFHKVGSHIFKMGDKEDIDHIMIKKL